MTNQLPEANAVTDHPVRFVVFHRPGPSWDHELGAIEQVGVADHFAFLQGLHESGVIAMAGPFVGGRSGGMFVTSFGLSQVEVERIARDDPAVQSGLISFECHAWLPTLSAL